MTSENVTVPQTVEVAGPQPSKTVDDRGGRRLGLTPSGALPGCDHPDRQPLDQRRDARQTAPLERLRVDRQLEEAAIQGPDRLHLAEVFGLDENTAMRYADSARALPEQAAEAGPAS
ncbi:hypothetical protein [Streptomyces sp. Ncost-T10-10d]|uniref:hypothetical protein n=1 Tax=Streptomyces sp. Ncost-T10-10d TaxID=1839774 RepID=UPI00081DC50F|nr:hypothetical protein [Streptomyces sp. Ncost-T10-10d]SCF72245.1 hypothetical protein GA0115254_113025 [Streptomyces sp. Ncost-T10-10d]